MSAKTHRELEREFVLEQQWQDSLTEDEPGPSESLGDSQPQESISALS